jgi:hypothetical protein
MNKFRWVLVWLALTFAWGVASVVMSLSGDTWVAYTFFAITFCVSTIVCFRKSKEAER